MPTALCYVRQPLGTWCGRKLDGITGWDAKVNRMQILLTIHNCFEVEVKSSRPSLNLLCITSHRGYALSHTVGARNLLPPVTFYYKYASIRI